MDDRANAVENPRGVGSTQADGADYYRHQLRMHTSTDLDAQTVHRIGLEEVARIHGEMEALMARVGFEGDLQAFFAHVSADPRFKYPDTDAGRQAYVDDASRAIDNIKQVLPEYFGLLPKADLVVKRVEPFREQPGAAQHYMPGTADGSRPGVYYAHLSDMNAMPKPELEVIAYHEGLPGHHMQLSIAQELTGVPEFRTQARSTAYSEGWGLYAEWLAREMPGTYADPYSEYGRLASELWRAVRLVVDTGLHSRQMTREQAIDYLLANLSTTPDEATSAIERYMAIPGQALGYKIGQLKIRELRAKYEKQLGSKFNLSTFHDELLKDGVMPLAVLETKMDAWAKRQ